MQPRSASCLRTIGLSGLQAGVGIVKRPGYYVEGRWYRDHFHQARARAAHLAEEFGRPVRVLHLTEGATEAKEVCEVHNTIRSSLRGIKV